MIKELYRILTEMGVSQEGIPHFIDEFAAGEKMFMEHYAREEKEAHKMFEESKDSQSACIDGMDQESFSIYCCEMESAFKHTQIDRMKLLCSVIEKAIPQIGNAYKCPPHRLGNNYRLIVFDVDGTLLDSTKEEWFTHVWKTLDDVFGTKEENRKFETEYYQGRITYPQWVDKIISLYVERGANKEKLYQATEHIKPVEGAMETLLELRKKGKKLAVLSGSLNFVLDRHFPRDLFSQVEINELYFDERGKITGWKATPYGDGQQKALGLINICNRRPSTVPSAVMDSTASLTETVFVGDAGNDIYAMRMAELGIAFYPQQMLEFYSDIMVGSEYGTKKKDLREILRYV